MKKKLIIFIVIFVGCFGLISNNMYMKKIKADPVYYYRAKNTSDEGLILVTHESSRRKTLKLLDETIAPVADSYSDTLENGDTLIVKFDEQNNMTCYLGTKDDAEKEVSCSDEKIQGEIQKAKEVNADAEFKEFTNIWAKVEENNTTCYNGKKEVSCDIDDFTMDYDNDNLIYLNDI